MTVPSVVESWDRIHKWLEANAPKILASLNPGASDEEIAAAERSIGDPMPPDWRELYRVHNGLNQTSGYGNLFHGLNFFDLERVVREITQDRLQSESLGSDYVPVEVRKADTGIRRDDVFNLRWIALGHDWSRLLIRIDLDPGAGGQMGQVICVDSEFQVAIRLAVSVSRFIHDFAEDLEHGKYFLNAEALEEGREFLDCVPEIDVVNWWKSPRWKHLET
jgi:cell wall assembly regulator SMI1